MSTYAGFTYPRKLWVLPAGTLASRLAKTKQPQQPIIVGDCYYLEPYPLTRDNKTTFCYLDHPKTLRWQWADDVSVSIRHQGWFLDDFQDDTIRGVVFRLPKNRGFLAGASMGVGMATWIECKIIYCDIHAALSADRMAELLAEDEREYREVEELEA